MTGINRKEICNMYTTNHGKIMADWIIINHGFDDICQEDIRSESNLKFWWEISVDIINLILKASAQHLISFILHDGRN